MTSPLLDDVEQFLSTSGIAPTQFGKLSANDPNFVFELRAGRDYRRSTEQKIRDFMANYQPPEEGTHAH